jgi:hypothetical protein
MRGVNLGNKDEIKLNSYEVKTQSKALDFDARLLTKIGCTESRSLTSQSTLRLSIDVLQTNKRWYIEHTLFD